MNYKIYLTGLCCMFLFSCNEKAVYEETVNGHKMLVCDAGKLNSEVKDLLLSELVESVEIVPLETHDSCLVKNIWKVVVTDGLIGVLERDRRPYKLFDRKGKFITEIGQIGQGPHEYRTLICSAIDEKNNRIRLMEFARVNRLLNYDLEGNPCDDIPLHFQSLDKASFYVEDDVITVFSMPVTNREVFIFQQKLDGELIQAIPATEDLYANSYDGELFVFHNKDTYSIHYTNLDTLFNYDPASNKLIPAYHTRFESDAFHVYRELPNHYITLSNPSIIVNKKTKQANYYKTKNDFLGGLDVNYFMCDNDYLIIRYESFKLLEDLGKIINSPNLEKSVKDRISSLISSVDEDDNPVLVIGKLK